MCLLFLVSIKPSYLTKVPCKLWKPHADCTKLWYKTEYVTHVCLVMRVEQVKKIEEEVLGTTTQPQAFQALIFSRR